MQAFAEVFPDAKDMLNNLKCNLLMWEEAETKASVI
jgi:hypothetical protein